MGRTTPGLQGPHRTTPLPAPGAAAGTDPAHRTRRETLRAASWRLLVLGLPIAALWAAFGHPFPALVILAGEAVNMACLRRFGASGSTEVWGRIFLGTFAAVIFAASIPADGVDGSGMPWLVCVPLLACLLFGPREGFLWSAAVAGGLALLWAFEVTVAPIEHQVAAPLRPTFDLAVVLGALAAALWLAQGWQTAVRRAEEALRASEREFREAVEHLPVPFLRMEPAPDEGAKGLLRVVYRNPAASALEGTGAGTGGKDEAASRVEEDAELEAALRRLIVEGGVLRRAGIADPAIPCTYDLVATRMGAGVAVCLHDVTARARAEEELRRARQAADETSRLKSEFLANMSHEIRTPMNGILGMAEIVLETPLSPEQEECVTAIRSCAESLLGILNDILDLSKIEAGRLEYESIPFDLDELLETVGDSLAARAAERGLEWNVLRDHAVPSHLVGDPTRLRQVLLNLAGNAIKFTEKGEVALEVRLQQREARAATLRFEVRDTGPGIAAERLERVFEKFTQADASTTRCYGGTGLGLAISRQLVEGMGGSIHVTSAPGHGSTFWFVLPLGLAEASPPPPAPPEALVGTRVLVAEDNETNRRALAGQLRRLGCRSTCVPSGAEALQALRSAYEERDPYQILISDLRMPRMDGLELASAVRAEECLDSTRLILLSSWSGRDVEFDARAAGFQARLIKPVKIRALQREMLRVLGIPEVPEGAPATPAAAAPAAAGSDEEPQPRVLVAEDNAVNLRLACRLLQSEGIAAETAANGAEAAAAAAAGGFDLILMDCQMPVMDGYEATRRIRELPGAAGRVPIVAMTAQAMRGDRERCLTAGMDDYLSKPLDRVQFRAALQKWLKGAARSRPR